MRAGAGRTLSAVCWAREATGIARPLGRSTYFRNLLIALAGALAMAGQVDEAAAVIAEIETLAVPMIRWQEAELHQARAWITVAGGDLSRAR